MKNVSIVFLLIFVAANMFGQESTNDRKSIDVKLYTNFSFTPQYLYYENDSTNGSSRNGYKENINIFNFSPSIVFYNKKGNSSEIEISRLNFSNDYNKEYNELDSTGAILNTISESKQKHFDLYLRYEYKWRLFKKKDLGKFKTILGFSGTPFVSWNKYEPMLSSENPYSTTTVGIYLSVIPRIEYSINKKLYLDLNVPISVVTANFTSTNNEDPTLPVEQRTQSTFDFYNGPLSYAIRFGVGLRI